MNNIDRVKWARDFLSYNIKEGVYEPDFIDEMSDEEVIKFAEHEMDLADYIVDSYLEEDGEGENRKER